MATFRSHSGAAYDSAAFDVDPFDNVTQQSESWTASTQEGELWTPAVQQSEIWTNV